MRKSFLISACMALALAGFLAGRYTGTSNQGAHSGTKKVLYYVDPMHPSYRSNKPGIAPDCGMALVPVYDGEDQTSKLQLLPGAVYVDPQEQRLIGVQVQMVENNSGPRIIRTTGRVEADENRVFRMMAGAEGWVQSVDENTVGTLVKKDQVLAALYSRDFRNAEQAYLGSIATLDRVRGSHEDMDPIKMNDANLRINEDQLRSMGMGEPQIKELAKTRQLTQNIALTSPIDGIVLTHSIAPGLRFEAGTEFYRIADLSNVWITADILGNESQVYRPGSRVKVTVRERSKTVFATVSNDPPVFDSTSRTLKLRLQAENPDLILRPDMFVDLEFSASAPPGISIPQEAILDSGMQKIAYVESSEGVFEPRKLTLGSAFGDYVTVTNGLKFGDRIVTAGNFLIDSESRMRSPHTSAGPDDMKRAEASKPGASSPMHHEAMHAHTMTKRPSIPYAKAMMEGAHPRTSPDRAPSHE